MFSELQYRCSQKKQAFDRTSATKQQLIATVEAGGPSRQGLSQT